MNKKIVTYRGEKIYIGIDVHKKTYTFSAYCQGLVCKTATTPADPKQFTRDIRKWFYGAQIISVYEAGFSGFNLHRELKSAGISNIVINPASLEIASKDKVKNGQKRLWKTRNTTGNWSIEEYLHSQTSKRNLIVYSLERENKFLRIKAVLQIE